MRPPVIYHLSGRQRKDLLVRHTSLQIALPVPPHAVDDALDWARSVLPTDLREMATSAEERELTVAAIRGGDPELLTTHLGAIVGPEVATYVQTVVAIVVTLTPPVCRHTSTKVQWPHEVLFQGIRLP